MKLSLHHQLLGRSTVVGCNADNIGAGGKGRDVEGCADSVDFLLHDAAAVEGVDLHIADTERRDYRHRLTCRVGH